jgi:hypothetical protein
VISSVSLVVGGFLLLVALFRTPLKQRLGIVPSGAVEVLGVVRLTAKQHLHLVRLGPKLLLLNLAGGRVERVAEVSDPEEVEFILKSHQQGESRTVSHAMHDVLAHLHAGPGSHRDRHATAADRWEA